jgi:hypothetical protein
MTSGDHLPHSQPAPGEQPGSPTPFEIGLRGETVELTVMTRMPETETMVDALHTVGTVYSDRLQDDSLNLSLIEVQRLRVKATVAANLTARLRGREPYAPKPRQDVASDPAEERTLASRLRWSWAGKLLLGGPEQAAAGLIDLTHHEPESKPVTLKGADVDFLLESLQRAPIFLDEQADVLAGQQAPEPYLPEGLPEDSRRARISEAERNRQQWHLQQREPSDRAAAIRRVSDMLGELSQPHVDQPES